MKNKDRQQWLILVHQLPPNPTNLRVRIWRKLQSLGAVPIKNSVYVLPYNEKTNEDFQWLKQEIDSAGGEAAVFRADSVEGKTDTDIIAVFRQHREEEYSRLITEFEGLSGAVREQKRTASLSANKLSRYDAELGKLNQELERLIVNDFFYAPSGKKARTAFETCRRDLQAVRGSQENAGAVPSDPAKLKLADFQNKKWATRKNPHIDRLASGWLIKRFIDSRPRFIFVGEGESIENALTFDMVGADFTHQGEDCTFETLLKSFGLDPDAALRQIAEIVHDIDLKDNKFNRSEAVGVNAVVRGLAEIYSDDNERLRQSLTVFDGLYELFKSSPQPARKGTVLSENKGDGK